MGYPFFLGGGIGYTVAHFQKLEHIPRASERWRKRKMKGEKERTREIGEFDEVRGLFLGYCKLQEVHCQEL